MAEIFQHYDSNSIYILDYAVSVAPYAWIITEFMRDMKKCFKTSCPTHTHTRTHALTYTRTCLVGNRTAEKKRCSRVVRYNIVLDNIAHH